MILSYVKKQKESEKMSYKFYFLILTVFTSTFLFADPSYSAIPTIKIKDIKKHNLGKSLFFDVNLSSDKTVACANCHSFSSGGTDNLKVSYGVNLQEGDVNSPTIFNTRFNLCQGWLGEFMSIKERTKAAFLNKVEMNGDFNKAIIYIESNEKLTAQFQDIYSQTNEEGIIDSIAYYVSNLTTPNSRFDKYIEGNNTIYSKSEKEGYELFKNYGCVSCHNGVNVGGSMYQKFGLFNEEKISRYDDGRYKITKKEYDKYVYKVPSLRNVAKTFPYFHHGKVNTLQDAIMFMGMYQLGVMIPHNDIIKIEAFLKTLNGDIPNE